ncbi:phage tail tape measure protein [Lacticaseibacillus paracasei]|uniref:phage tail tape measure protein n=1 Tax=Lacticaseibacillus paracasei TaxID=1597 RepID=UPI002F2677BD
MANVVATFTANIAPFQAAMGKLSTAVKAGTDSASSAGQRVGSALTSIGKASTVAGLAVGAMAVGAIKSYGSFQESINKAAVIAGSSNKSLKGDMKGLEDEAISLGKTLPISAEDAGNAMVEMARNGASVSDLKKEFPSIAQAASVAGADLAGTATTVQQAMNIWGGGAKNAAKDSAILALNANMSNAEVEDMGQAFANVGSTAATLGIGIKDTSTAIGLMSNAGLGAAQGSQDLSHALTLMARPSKVAAGEMKELGITYTDAQGKFKPFPQILKEVAKATDGMSQSQKVAALTNLYGAAGAKAMLPLLIATEKKTKSGKSSWDEYSDSLGKVSSSSSAASKYLKENSSNMTKNVGQSIAQMKDSFDAVKNTSIGSIAPQIESVANALGNFATWLKTSNGPMASFVKGFIALSPVIAVVLIAVGLLTSGVGKMITSFKSIVGAAKAIGGGLKAVWGLMAANPIVTIIVAIAALVAGLVYFFTQTKTGQKIWSEFVSALKSMWNGLSSFFSGLWNGITKIFNSAAKGVQKGWDSTKSFFSNLWSGITSGASSAWSGTVNGAKSAWSGLGSFFSGMWSGITSGASEAWNGLSSFLSSSWSSISSTASSIWGGISSFFSGLWNGIVTIATAVWGTYGSSLTSIWNGIVQVASGVFNMLKAVIMGPILLVLDLIDGGWNKLGSDLQLIWTNIVSAASQIWNGLVTYFTGIWSLISTFAVTEWNAIVATLEGIWTSFIAGATAVWSTLVLFFTGLWDGIVSYAEAAWTGFTSFLSGVWNAIVSTAEGIWNALPGFFSGLWNGIVSYAQGAWNNVTSFLSGLWSGTVSTAEGIWNALPGFFSGLWNGITSFFSSAWNNIRSIVMNAASNIVNGARSVWSGFTGVVSNVVNGIRNAFNALRNINLLDAGRAIMDSFFSGLTAAWSKVQSFVGGIASWIRQHKGPISYDAKLLIPAGNAIMGGLNQGLQKSFGAVQKTVSGMASDISDNMSANISNLSMAGTQFSSGDVTQSIDASERITPNIYVQNNVDKNGINSMVKEADANDAAVNSYFRPIGG